MHAAAALAINAIKAKVDDKEQFISSLKVIKESIKKSPHKSKKKTKFTLNDDFLFLQRIIQHSRDKLLKMLF